MVNSVLAVLACPTWSVPLTLIVKVPLAPAPSSEAVQAVPPPVTVPAVTAPGGPPVTDVTNATLSGLLDAIVSTGEEVALAGLGAAVGVSVGGTKSKTIGSVACEVLPRSPTRSPR